MKLPKLYRVVKIEFSSLRSSLGPNLGVIHDSDEMVDRMARRVRIPEGWKWQIKDLSEMLCWGDYSAETDQEILNEIGSNMSFVLIIG